MIEDLWSPRSKRGLVPRTPRSFNDQHTEFEKHRTWVNGEADGPHCISSCKDDRCFGFSRGDPVRTKVVMSHCILKCPYHICGDGIQRHRALMKRAAFKSPWIGRIGRFYWVEDWGKRGNLTPSCVASVTEWVGGSLISSYKPQWKRGKFLFRMWI